MASMTSHHTDRLTALGLVAVGGIAGSLLRWGVAEALPEVRFAWHTIVVNLAGALVIGLLFGMTTSAHWRARVLIGTGFCGGLTTFSTWVGDTHAMLDDHHWWLGFVNIAATLVIGVAAAALGLMMGRRRRAATQ